MSEKEYTREKCIEFGRRNWRLTGQLRRARYSRWNYMALAGLGWLAFIASQAGWLPK